MEQIVQLVELLAQLIQLIPTEIKVALTLLVVFGCPTILVLAALSLSGQISREEGT